MKEMYYLFIWQDSSTNGTFLACRSFDKQEFYEQFKEILKRYLPYNNVFKIVRYKNMHVISYCDSSKPYDSWKNSKPTGKVDLCEIVRLDKVFDML
jgi:hypothetical protein